MGAVNINGAPLEFDAVVDLSAFDQHIEQMAGDLDQFARGQVRSQEAINQKQREYTRLILGSADALKSLSGAAPTVSQTSVDAFRSHREDIIGAIAAFKQYQQAGTVAVDFVQKNVQSSDSTMEHMGHTMEQMAGHAEHAGHAMHDMAGEAAATGKAALTQQQLAEALKDVRAEGKNAKEEFRQLNTAFHSLFHGKSGDESLGAQWSNGIKQGRISIGEFIASLTLTDKQLAGLPEKLEKAGYVAKGTFTAMAQEAGKTTQAIGASIQKIESLQGAVSGAGGGVAVYDTKGVEAFIQKVNEARNLPPVQMPPVIPPKVPTGSLNEMNRELESLKAKYADLSKVDRDSDIGKGLLQNIQKVESEIDNINKAFLRVEQHAAGSLNEKVAQLQRLKDQYAALSDIDRRSTAGRGMAQNISNLDREVQKINGEFSQTESLIKKAGVAIGAYLSFQGATNFIGDLVRVRGEFQQLEVAFNTMLGSKAKADQLMGQIVNLAATTPFTLQEVAGGAKQLLAYGFAAENVTDILRRMGDIAAGTGTDISGLVMTLGQVQNKGRLQAEEMMQFAERGVPIVQALADRFGVAKTEIAKMVETGKVGFDDVYAAIKGLTDQGGIFFNLMEQQSHTLTGQISNLKDAWSRMLNDMGKSQEGVFSGAISAATDLVNNYQTVLDIIKVLVVTYGSYRAAVITTNAVTAISTSLTKGWTLAETLRYRAMLLSEGAMKLLNRTMLSNPFVAVATVVGTLVSAFVLFRKEVSEVKTKSELLAQSQKDMASSMAEAESKIRPYIEALKNANLSEQERLNIYNELKKIDPKIVEGIDQKTISYEKLKNNVNAYLAALRQQITLEGNKKALQASIEQENAIKAKIKAQDDLIKSLQSYGKNTGAVIGGSSFALTNAVNESNQNLSSALADKDKLLQDLKDQEKVSQELGEGIVPPAPKKGQKTLEDYLADQINLLTRYEEYIKLVGNKTDAEKVKKALTEKMESFAPGDAAKEAYKKRIQEVNELLKKYSVEDPTKNQKKQEAAENRLNDLLRDRAELLKTINDLQDDAAKRGNTKEETEIDRINLKYDKVLKQIDDYNFKAKKIGAQQIGQTEIDRVTSARNSEIGAERQKQEAEGYKTSILEQKKVFEDFENYKLQYGTQKANELFLMQVGGFTSYIDKLQAELDSLTLDDSVGGRIKKQFLTSEIVAAGKAQTARQIEEQRKAYTDLFQLTITYEGQREQIETKYGRMRQVLNQQITKLTEEEYNRQNKALTAAKEEELNALKIIYAKQAPLFKKLNEDLFLFTKDDIKKRVKELKDALAEAIRTGKIKDKDGNLIPLTPKMIEEITQGIRQAESEAAKLGTVAGMTKEKWDEIATKAREVASLFSAMADALRPVNENLADGLSQLSEMANMAGSLASAAGSFAAGDYVSGATSSMQAIGGIVKIFTDAKLSAQQAQAAMQAFAQGQVAGALQYNELLRQRAILQAQSNRLTLEGLKAQREALELARKQNTEDYNKVLKLLQQEQFITGQHTEKGKGTTMFGAVGYLLGIGAKTNAVNDMASLAGMNFDQLEELFNKGQLTEQAKALFQQLQKLKEEGVDIDKQLQDLQEKSKEIFTGTTSNSILDSIIDGFKQGKREAADFADNFEELMRGAMLNSLKFQYLEGPLKDFFDQFAQASQSDGQLTQTEIDQLKSFYSSIIENASQQFDQIQQIAGISMNTAGGGSGNSLTGAIKGMTETQAELLAGQFGGLRLTALDQLKLAQEHLTALNAIQANTALAAVRLESVVSEIQDQTGRMKQWFLSDGIKIK